MAVNPQTRKLAARIRRLERQALQRKQPSLAFSSIDGDIGINDADGNPIGSIGSGGVDAPGVVHQATVDAIELDLQNAYDEIAAGDSANSQAIDAAVDDYIARYGTVDAKIDNAVDDFNAGLATKSKHTLSLAAPTAVDANNAGDVWEQYAVVSVEGDGTPVSPPQNRVIGRWRGAGGTGVPQAAPYTWTAMDLDATFIPKLDIGTGTFGDLTGTRIAARTIGAQQMVVTDWTNLIPDISEWNGSLTDAEGPVVVVTGNGTGNTHFTPKGGSPYWPVKPGDVFRFEWDAYAAYAGKTGGLHGYFRTFAQDKTTLVAPSSFDIAVVPQGSAQSSPYATFSGELTVPAGCYWLNFLPYVTANGQAAIRRMSLRKKYGGELIVDGSIYAQHVAARSIGADKLLVSDFTDLLHNSDFAPTMGNWTLAAGWSYYGTSGRTFMKYTGDVHSSIYSNLFPVTPGKYYHASAIGAQDGVGASAIFRMMLRWYRSDLSLVGTDTYGPSHYGTYDYATFEVSGVAPTGASFAEAHLVVDPAAAGGSYYFEWARARHKYGGELIVDGTLLARHVSADMVNGLIVTGSAIQTSDQGAPSTWTGGNLPKGIKITDTGLVAYSSGIGAGAAPLGTAVTSINANTGRMSAVGGLATATGYDDISITAGDASTPAALRFHSDGVGIDNLWPATLSMSDGTWSIAGTATYAATLSLQGAKYGTAGVGGVPRSRIDFLSQRNQSGTNAATITQSDIYYHAGASGGRSGGHFWVIDDVAIADIHNTGLFINGGKGIGIGQFPLANGLYATGKIKSSAAIECDTGFYDMTLALDNTTTPAYIGNNGRVIRQPSTRAAKKDIEPLSESVARRALDMEPVVFTYRDTETFGDTRWPGFVAEQADEVGAALWVSRDGEGKPIGIRYAEVTAAHNVLIKDLYERDEENQRTIARLVAIIEGAS